MMLENKLLNDESLELNIVISRKNLQVSTHLHKMTESERKSSKLTVCFSWIFIGHSQLSSSHYSRRLVNWKFFYSSSLLAKIRSEICPFIRHGSILCNFVLAPWDVRKFLINLHGQIWNLRNRPTKEDHHQPTSK